MRHVSLELQSFNPSILQFYHHDFTSNTADATDARTELPGLDEGCGCV